MAAIFIGGGGVDPVPSCGYWGGGGSLLLFGFSRHFLDDIYIIYI